MTTQSAARLVLAGVTVIAGGIWLYVVDTRPDVESREHARPPALVRPFTFRLATSDGPEAASRTGGPPAWHALRIGSDLAFDYVPIGRPDQQCVAENIADDLAGVLRFRELRGLLEALPTNVDCGEPCPSCTRVDLEWVVEEEHSALALTGHCWHTHPQIQPLRTAVEGVVAAAYGRVICG